MGRNMEGSKEERKGGGIGEDRERGEREEGEKKREERRRRRGERERRERGRRKRTFKRISSSYILQG